MLYSLLAVPSAHNYMKPDQKAPTMTHWYQQYLNLMTN